MWNPLQSAILRRDIQIAVISEWVGFAVLAHLIPFGNIWVEVVLSVWNTLSIADFCNEGPVPSLAPSRLPLGLGTAGNVPGRPRQIGHTRVFGSPPNATEQRQNILDWVANSA